jgi:hypothetical protein
MGAYQIAGALEWFPDRNELIFIDGDWGVWRWQPSTNQWTEIATTTGGGNPALPKLPMRSYQNFSRYSPAAHAIWFGGTTPIYKYDASGNFTTLKPAPFNLGIQSSVISVDPVSGKYLILPEMGAGVTQFWQYDLSTDTWLQLPNTVPTALYSGPSPFGVGDGLIVAPISTYGVLMYVKYNFGQSAIYLYKHAPSTPPTTSPCDVNGDGVTNVADVQLEVNMALGINPCTNASGTCTVVSVQRVVNAALGGQCVAP